MALFGLFSSRRQDTPEGRSDGEKHPLTIAFEKGGPALERALDVLQGSNLGQLLRSGGSEAIKAFTELYDIACDCGNSDSANRLADRFLPLLPPREREIAKHRCGLDGSAGSESSRWLKRKEQAEKEFVDAVAATGLMADVGKQLKEEFEAELRKGGPAAI